MKRAAAVALLAGVASAMSGCDPAHVDAPMALVYDEGWPSVLFPVCAGDEFWTGALATGGNDEPRLILGGENEAVRDSVIAIDVGPEGHIGAKPSDLVTVTVIDNFDGLERPEVLGLSMATFRTLSSATLQPSDVPSDGSVLILGSNAENRDLVRHVDEAVAREAIETYCDS